MTFHLPSRNQAYYLESLALPGTTDAYRKSLILAHAIIVHPGIDSQRMARAFDTVTRRHDSLRTEFRNSAEGWRVWIDPRHKTGLQVRQVDFGSHEELVAEVERCTYRNLDIESEPLFQAHLLQNRQFGDVLLLRFHNLVADGWSLILVFNELVKAYLGLPLGAQPLSYEAYRRGYVMPEDDAAMAASRAYWNKRLYPVVPRPNLGRAAKGLAPNHFAVAAKAVGRCDCSLSMAHQQDLVQAAAIAGTTANTYLLAAQAKVLGSRAGMDDLYITVGNARRERPEMYSFVGFVTEALPVRCTGLGRSSVSTLTRSLDRQIQAGMPYFPPCPDTSRLGLLREIAEAGGHLRQFEGGAMVPDMLLKRSPLSRLFATSPGKALKVGPISIERVQLPSSRLLCHELALRWTVTDKKVDLSAFYDTEAFDDDEVSTLLYEMIAAAGLDTKQGLSFTFHGSA